MVAGGEKASEGKTWEMSTCSLAGRSRRWAADAWRFLAVATCRRDKRRRDDRDVKDGEKERKSYR